MQAIDRFFEGSNLMAAHAILALIGVFLSVFVMQLTHYEAEDDADPGIIRSLRRVGLALLAWALLWSLSYSYTKGWQPWPAELMMNFSIDVILLNRAMAIKQRIKRTGVKPDAPRAEEERARL